MKTLKLILLMAVSIVSCKKQDEWLDKKSSKSDVVPSTLDDFQAILDNTDIMNDYYPYLGQVSADNYTISDPSYNSIKDYKVRNLYSWQSDIYEGSITTSTREWSAPYEIISYTNIALEGLNKISITESNLNRWNNIKGSALFFRAYAFYNLAQLFCKPYDSTTTAIDLGIPLRLNSDVNVVSVRSTIKGTYDQIINDLLQAESLLPDMGQYKTRPSKAAVYALLAKTYLIMGDYQDSKKYVEMALKIDDTLIDYNDLSTSKTYSLPNFKTGNPEVLFFSFANGYSVVNSRANQIVSSELYKSYDDGDLRKNIFYRGSFPNISFTGNQTGNGGNFSGLATNELYLIKAECLFRLGNITNGLEFLDRLLRKRWNKKLIYKPCLAKNEDEALKLIISERRKELPFTSNLRWEDLRRFNKDSRFAIALTKIINGKSYTLPPNDPRYVFPIPPIEILKSNIQQNIR
ncbi:RagB/SusD family nutrient uptake outer membrane protein [Sphingobacterium sp. DR205]|uniref:RagB/SusD family nutrient uptake outer membrane protein n=1 Tax=Sphingobacterium sp. DR205 TaxID=2713573 RepID=UPI0013E4AA22|nr:RagB/SusD family nutrient uptake outer membrane protein [Sphingobacterium sp. DR205]QIH34466.1 RagB/SusD family nutrient uptake outer membrane protein [Sphingobacterium sp. DR205]